MAENESQPPIYDHLIATKYRLPGTRTGDIVHDRLRNKLDLALQYPLTVVSSQADREKQQRAWQRRG